jgi:methionyl-tRNA formyltransferase
METGGKLVLKTVEAISSASIRLIDQEKLIIPGQLLKKAPKISKEDCRINWKNQSSHVFNFIRGMSPYPGAYTEVTDKEGNTHLLKIFKTRIEQDTPGKVPGIMVTDGKSYIKISTNDGFLHLLEVQLQGRKVMNSIEFLNGYGRQFS